MLRRFSALMALVFLAVPLTAFAQVSPVPTAVQFQGRLTRPNGTPVPDGNFTLTVKLYDAATGGTLKFTQTLNNVPVRNGIIAVLIGLLLPTDFAGDRWLEIQIGSDPPLTPRQRLVTVPYAFKAGSVVDGSIATNSLVNNAVTAAKIAPGTITAANLAVGVLDFWSLLGNAGTNPAVNFLGTTDDQPLLLKVNNRRAVRYASVENTATAGFEFRGINTVGGNSINSVALGTVGATIAGGGKDFFTASDEPNTVSADFGAIGGGANNTASGQYSVVSGGKTNIAGGSYSAVGGGTLNTASGEYASVMGGYSNKASNSYATAAGGFDNEASGIYSFAIGRHAKANHLGTFVFNNNLGDFSSTANNQFLIQADGGVGIGTNTPNALLDVSGNAHFALNVGIGTTTPLTKLHVQGSLHLSGTTQDISTDVGSNLQFGHFDGTTFTERMIIDGTGHVGINDSSPLYRLELPNIAVDGEGRARANRWDTYSSGRWKHNVVPIENALDKVLRMRGVMFDWNREHGGTHDIGFVAEEAGRVVPELVSWEADGKNALGMAYDRVTALLVEAVKQQQAQRESDRTVIERLRKENTLLQGQFDTLQARVTALEKAFLRR